MDVPAPQADMSPGSIRSVAAASNPQLPAADAPGRSLADDPTLRTAIELLFFAYREFTREADQLLSRYGFGRAHHRVIYFVGRHPGMTVGELLTILQITKQSLSRVLSELMRGGFVVQRTDTQDRRRRRLFLTAEAEALERTLTERQATLLAESFAEAGTDAAAGFARVLSAMLSATDRDRLHPSG